MSSKLFHLRLIAALTTTLVVTGAVWLLLAGLSASASEAYPVTWQSPIATPTALSPSTVDSSGGGYVTIAALGGIGLGLALALGVGLIFAHRHRRHNE